MNKAFTLSFLTLILSVIFVTPAFAYDVEVNGIYYNLFKAKKTAEVTRDVNNKYNGDIVIPSTIAVDGDTFSVTSIEGYAFYDCTGLTTINIPNSVIEIGENVFNGCTKLTNTIIVNDMFVFLPKNYKGHYSIPDNITRIIGGAFKDCTELSSVSMPNTVTSIGREAFYYCNSLTSVNIPNSLTSIGSYAFSDCYKLSSAVSMPNSVTSIGESAFNYCMNLTSVTISNSVSSIEEKTFYHCISLTSVNIPNSVTSIGNSAFYDCMNLTSITIPEHVTDIKTLAFSGCGSLTSVTIPNSVKYIGTFAFQICEIEKLFFDSNCTISVFQNEKIKVKELYIGDNVKNIHNNFNQKLLRKVYLGKNVSVISRGAFENSNIEEFTITGEEPPSCDENIFGTQDLSSSTLYVPESKSTFYQTTEPWSNFGHFLTLSGESPVDPEKCGTPSIAYEDGKLKFTCETADVQFASSISCADVRSFDTDEVELTACYDISVTAKKDGLLNSETATAKLYWLASADQSDNINTVEKRGIVIYSAGGNINISGLENNERVDFYDADGKTLGTTTAIDGTAFFSAKSGNIVIVKIGKESIKVVVK